VSSKIVLSHICTLCTLHLMMRPPTIDHRPSTIMLQRSTSNARCYAHGSAPFHPADFGNVHLTSLAHAFGSIHWTCAHGWFEFSSCPQSSINRHMSLYSPEDGVGGYGNKHRAGLVSALFPRHGIVTALSRRIRVFARVLDQATRRTEQQLQLS